MSELALFLTRTRSPVFLADDECQCVDANPGDCRLLGLGRSQLIARPIDDWLATDDHEHMRVAWAELLKHGTLAGRLRLRVTGRREAAAIEFRATAHLVPGRHLVILSPPPAAGAAAGEDDEERTATSAPEREVMELVAAGTTTDDVAGRLFISHETVRRHVKNAMTKLGAHTRAQPTKGVRLTSVKRFAVSAEDPGLGAPRVSVQGEIDMATVDLVRRHAHRRVELHGPRLVLDRVQTSFMDASGLRLTEGLRRRTSENGGALVVVVATYGVRRLLEIAPPCSDVRVVVAPSRRDAAARHQRLWSHPGRVAAA